MKVKHYRVAASCFEPDVSHAIEQRRQAFRDHLAALLQEQKPDLLVLPEVALVPDFDRHERCGAEPSSGPAVQTAAAFAKRFSANICMPIIEIEAGKLYNTAVYLDRKGNHAGSYRKHVPTAAEIKQGICPGAANQQPVILDGLRIGTAICFDENFPDLIWNWIARGVDLLTFPAYTYAGNLMRYWALHSGVPLVCAFPWESVIYDRDGAILAHAGTHTDTVRFGYHAPWIACNLNFQSRTYHLDENQAKLPHLAARYGGQLDIRLMVKEARMILTAVADALDIEQVEQEMELIPLQKYLRESRAYCHESVKK